MKKVVMVIISAITLITMVFVAIFGTKPNGIVPSVYIDKITILPSDNSTYQKAENEEDVNKMVLVYDTSNEVEYEGNYYMPYIFKTEILPENATNRSFTYYVDDLSKSYIDFPPENHNASSRGAFLVKKMTNKTFVIVDIHCRALDGGKAKISTLRLIIDYRNVKEN